MRFSDSGTNGNEANCMKLKSVRFDAAGCTASGGRPCFMGRTVQDRQAMLSTTRHHRQRQYVFPRPSGGASEVGRHLDTNT